MSSGESSTFPAKEKCRVLIVGCGTSRLGEEMMIDGWTGGIKNVDYSNVVIEQMKNLYDKEFYRKLRNRLKREKKGNQGNFKKSNQGCLSSLENKKNQLPTADDKASVDVKEPYNESSIIEMTFECADVTKRLPYQDSSIDLILIKGTLDSVLCSNGAIKGVKSMMQEVCDLNFVSFF